MNSEVAVVSPKEPEFIQTVGQLQARAASFPAVIEDEPTAEAMTEFVGNVRGTLKAMEKDRKSITDPIREGLNKIMDRYKRMAEPLSELDSTLAPRLLKWAADKRAKAEAAARAEAERRRAEAEAEQRRIAEVAAAQARAKAEAEAQAKIDAAADAFARGDMEAVEGAIEAANEIKVEAEEYAKEVIQEAEEVVIPYDNVKPIETITRTTSGKTAGTRRVWTFREANIALVPGEYLMVNEKKVKEAIARGVREIPGLEIYEEDQLRIGK